jgi:adenylate cyclase
MALFQNRKRNVKLHSALISGAILLAGILAYFIGFTFLDTIELKTMDMRFLARQRIAPGPEIVLAVIDEKSIAREGRWVWPRTKIVRLVERLSDAGARVIAFDIGFLEPDDQRVIRVLEQVESALSEWKTGDERLKKRVEALKYASDNDRQLAAAIRDSRSEVVLGYFFQMDPEVLDHMTEEEINRHQQNIQGSAYKTVRFASVDAQRVPLIRAVAPQSNIRVISEAAGSAGYFNMYPDPDGVVRWMPGVLRFNEAYYAPLSLAATSAYLKEPLGLEVAEYGVDRIKLGKLSIPTDEYGRILINYRGEEKTFPHISITDILHDQIDPDALADKIVVVGATAVGIYDLRVTPFGTVFPGLEIHANIIDSILSQDFMYQPAWAAMFDVLVMVVCSAILGLLLARVGALYGALAGGSLCVLYVLLCQFLFSYQAWVLNLVYPLTVILLIYASVTVYRYLVETRQKKFVKEAFSTYLAPSVVNNLLDSPEKLVLGGEKRVITAFFSDVQGFTSISETLLPEELVELLNEFLTEMTDIILRHEGTVDKFEGDAIIAFFGAPNDLENQAEVACMACIDMQKRLAELRNKWEGQARPGLYMRIGLCTGPAVVGNMGSRSRMDYTMMGDTVNTAARLEGVNKVYGTYTMISESTYTAAGGWIRARELDAINVVGKKEPVKIYELIGYPSDVDEHMQKAAEIYSRGLSAYRSRQWDKAAAYFSKAMRLRPEDRPSGIMMERCLRYKADPPDETWNGAFTMTTK